MINKYFKTNIANGLQYIIYESYKYNTTYCVYYKVLYIKNKALILIIPNISFDPIKIKSKNKSVLALEEQIISELFAFSI